MFDEKTISHLGYYVYALIDPRTNLPFYIGKGLGNRVFEHLKSSVNCDDESLKLDKIRSISADKLKVEHIIIRHGLTEKESLEVEASLIDYSNFYQFNLDNIVEGHHSESRGLMKTDEVIRLHNAKPLLELLHPVIIININKKYNRGSGFDEIYNATKEAWVVSKSRIKEIKYALSEFKGIIIEVFEIKEWYSVNINQSNKSIVPDFSVEKKADRWGFNGNRAPKEVRDVYLNKSIAHLKKQGAANPIRYTLFEKQSKELTSSVKIEEVSANTKLKINLGKPRAIELLKNEFSEPLSNLNTNWSVINKSGFWSVEPNFERANHDWFLILNNNKAKKLHLFKVTKMHSVYSNLYRREDKEVYRLVFEVDDKQFVEKSEKISFNKFYIGTCKY